MDYAPFPLIDLSGNPRERGRQHGKAAPDRIKRGIDMYAESLLNSGVDWKAIFGAADLCSLHNYSGGDVSMTPTVAGWCAANGKPWITEEFGYQQGFDTFTFAARAPAEEIVKIGSAKIDQLAAEGRPFFVYLHFLDPHDPYTPPGEYKTAFTGDVPSRAYPPKELQRINLYDGEIKYMDNQIGKLFSHLKDEGLYDDLTIIVVADHGEQFMEHGQHGHGHQLFNEEVHVPLFVKSPRLAEARVVDVTASTVDIFPTALDAAEIAAPAGLPGVSLMNDAALEARSGVFTEIEKDFRQKAFTTPDGVKLIRQTNPNDADVVLGVFDFRKDPLEKSPISDHEVVATLSGELAEANRYALEGKIAGTDTGRAQMKESTVEQLKTLGYLQ